MLLYLPANTDIDECQEEKLCGDNATCINTHGSYRCVWISGYGLKSANTSSFGEEEQGEGEDQDMLIFIVDLKSSRILSYKEEGGRAGVNRPRKEYPFALYVALNV